MTRRLLFSRILLPSFAFAAVVAVCPASPLRPRRQLLDRVAARVNSEIITENQMLMRAFGRLDREGGLLPGAVPDFAAVLDEMIDEALMAQAASEEIKETPDERITNRVEADVRSRIAVLGSEEAFKAALEKRGWDLESYKKYLREQEERLYVIRTALARRVRITQEEIDRYEKELRRSGKSVIEYLLQHILIAVPPSASAAEKKKTEERVKQLLEQLYRGEPFEKLAREHSDDDATKQSGGDLGWMGERDLLRPVREAVKTVKAGRTSQPVQTPRGLHIFKVLATRGPREMLFEKRMNEEQRKWAAELRRGAQVKILLPLPGK